MLNTLLKSFDTTDTVATASTSFTLSLTGFGLIVIPIGSSIACGLSIANKIVYEIIMQKCKKYKKNNIKTINKQINFSINYMEKLYKTM